MKDYAKEATLFGFYTEDDQKFAILQNGSEYSRVNFDFSDEDGLVVGDTASIDVEGLEAQFELSADEGSEAEEEPVEEVVESEEEKEEESAEEEVEAESEEEEEKEEEPAPAYNLEEIQEYIDLSKQYEELQTSYAALEAEVTSLREFKNQADRKQKQEMINSFYMLSDEEKADVVNNIDSYSVDEIEAKLAVICVRNKVSFDLDDEENKDNNPTVYNLGSEDDDDAGIPLWVKSVRNVAKTMEQ